MRLNRTRFISTAMLLAVGGFGCSGLHVREDGPRRWTSDWYDQEAKRPDGSRQIHSHGLEWPPYPRPCGEGQQLSTRFHEAHYWPHPYNCQDLAYLRAVSASQVTNGWQKETTLYSYHFDEKDNTLNHAGKLRLKWVLQTIPEERRSVFVQMSDDKSVSEARLANVRAAAVEIVGENALPPIMLRMDTPDGRPTDEVNQIQKKVKAATRTPQINYSTSNGSSSGSSGGSGGGNGSP
jgi:hypothetical protein